MCIKNMRLNFISLFILLIANSGYCAADFDDYSEVEILQTKMNRFYFASGEEENIFQDCSYIITKSKDTLYKGQIEVSFTGISYSYINEYINDSINIDSCTAFVQTAKIDSLTPIIIGILKSIPYGASSNFPGITAVSSNLDSTNNKLSKYGNILHTYQYETDTEMLIDFESGLLDAFVSYNDEGQPQKTKINNKLYQTISTPAPFYAALIPNISKDVNSKGILTTSLYYRFNDRRISSVFDGDNIAPYFSLYPADKTNRMYAYNPDNGRNLLKYLGKKPKKLFLSVGNSSLEKLGLYFADILSRDKIRAKFTEDESKADIYFKFIPLSNKSIDTSLIYIHDILRNNLSDSKNNNQISGTLLEITHQLESAGNALSVQSQSYYLDLAQRSLIEDLGIFPLLRPTLFFTIGENLKGFAFDSNGWLDLSDLRKVILPPKSVGTAE